VEQELLTLPEHLSSPPVFSGVCVIQSLVLCVCFVDRWLFFCTFSFGHCVVCSSSIYGFWLPLWYLQTLLISCLLRRQISIFRQYLVVSNKVLSNCWITQLFSSGEKLPKVSGHVHSQNRSKMDHLKGGVDDFSYFSLISVILFSNQNHPCLLHWWCNDLVLASSAVDLSPGRANQKLIFSTHN